MCCKNNEESQCCVAVHKDKIVPCALVVLTIAFTIAGFVIGHRFIGKGCCENQDEEQRNGTVRVTKKTEAKNASVF